MRTIYILILIVFAKYNASGQNHLDSLKHYLKQKPKLTGYLDGRNSFTEANRNQIFGAFVGANFGSRLDLGLAWYTTYNEPSVPEYLNEGTPAQDTEYHRSIYNYFSLRTAYEFYHSPKWEFYLPLGIGIGSAKVETFDVKPTDKTLPILSERPRLVPLDVGIDGTYLFTKWFVFSAGLGYRLNLVNSQYQQQLSAVYYRFGFGLRFGYIYNKVKSSKLGRNCCCLI